MNVKDKQRIGELREQLEQIDELNWHGSGMVPEYARWYNVIGDEDAHGNWKFPAELLGRNDVEVKRIKAQRNIIAQIRVLLPRDDREEVHRTTEEQQTLIENVVWCKAFGLGNQATAFVLGENQNYINKLSSKLKRQVSA
ncbi:hypothetical protein [Weissella viridescens]|uniref:hypothetical protein n=1 Tax=Weissella viridescens TaxID=1629 RepID=UPI003AF30C90